MSNRKYYNEFGEEITEEEYLTEDSTCGLSVKKINKVSTIRRILSHKC